MIKMLVYVIYTERLCCLAIIYIYSASPWAKQLRALVWELVVMATQSCVNCISLESCMEVGIPIVR